jgi:4-aminobutyrate aminotransferase-like enzyme
MTDAATVLERRQRVLGPRAPLFYDQPLQLVRGEDVWVYDETGKRYLDAYNNVPHVGHCHPRVVEAICRQAGRLNIHTRYLHETILDYSERLTSSVEPSLSRVMLCCTGTEANELALRIARAATGHSGIIVSDCSYHGNSSTLAALTTAFQAGESLGANMRAIKIADAFSKGAAHDSEPLEGALDDLRNAIASLQASGHGVAALLLDTLFTAEGVVSVPPSFVRRAAKLVREAGGLLIADEVQAGLGRTGETLWGYQRHAVVPDLVTLGKPLGNGHPLAGVIVGREIADRFTSGAMYFNTFAGNPVSCAAGLAVLDVIRDQQLQQNARRVGEHLQTGLREMAKRHVVIGDVRGTGLFVGVELVQNPGSRIADPQLARMVVNRMKERGVLMSRIGPRDNVLKIRPPMTFSAAHADQLLETLDAVLLESVK